VLTGHASLATAGITIALAATAVNWWRLSRNPSQPWRGSLRLELRWFRTWTVLRWLTALAGAATALAGGPAAVALVLLAGSELIGRWLFYVTVVPLNMPGAFWRGTAGSHR
jgi:DMSO reductase anchor subunit